MRGVCNLLKTLHSLAKTEVISLFYPRQGSRSPSGTVTRPARTVVTRGLAAAKTVRTTTKVGAVRIPARLLDRGLRVRGRSQRSAGGLERLQDEKKPLLVGHRQRCYLTYQVRLRCSGNVLDTGGHGSSKGHERARGRL